MKEQMQAKDHFVNIFLEQSEKKMLSINFLKPLAEPQLGGKKPTQSILYSP